MKSSFTTHLVIVAIVAVAGFFVLPVVAATLSSGASFALGAVVSGLLIAYSSSPRKTSTSTSTSSHSRQNNSAATGTGTTLYVGNLPYRANEQAVRDHFSTAGKVLSVRLMRDRRTGKRKGYGFVEIANTDTQKVIDTFNDQEFQERTLKVRLSKDKVE